MTLAQDLGKIGDALGGNRPLAGFRNAIINGNFDIWQRGTSFSNPASGAYTADRWFVAYGGSGATRTISRQAFALGQTDVPGEPTYFLRHNQSVAGTSGTFNTIEQRIESVRTFAGQQVTLGFYAKAAASLVMPNILLRQVFGTGGSPSSAADTTLVTNQTITTSWAKYTYTATLPSISGKTLGSDNNDQLNVILLVPLNTTFTFDIAQVQLEAGPIATPFERRPIGTELALCQRYYQVVPTTAIKATNFVTTSALTSIDHSPLMRSAPSFTLSNTDWATFHDGAAFLSGTIALQAFDSSFAGSRWQLGGISSSAASRAIVGYSSTTTFGFLSAEL